MTRIKLGLYCPGCLPGYHLPYVGGAQRGLFARHGIEVEILEPAPGPANVERVSSGALDFCITSVAHLLNAKNRTPALKARFVASIVQRSPIGGLVAANSAILVPADLSYQRLGTPPGGGLGMEYAAALRHRGLAHSVPVDLDYGAAPAALGRGKVAIVPDFVDLIPRTRRQAGVEVRAICVGPESYASGLVARDSISTDLVATMRGAIVSAIKCQREDPRWGLAALCERYPSVNPADALEGWSLAASNIFTGVPVGTMEADRWRFTIDYLSAAYGVATLPAGQVYRSELAEPATASSAVQVDTSVRV